MRENNQSGRAKSYGKSSYASKGREKAFMHKVICDKCGKRCEVPFKPSSDKPVLCSECFEEKKNSGENSRYSNNRDFRRPSYNDKEMFTAKCDECGKSCELPFKPSGNKPVYCSQCFENKGNSRGGNNRVELKEELDVINTKLDQILKALEI